MNAETLIFILLLICLLLLVAVIVLFLKGIAILTHNNLTLYRLVKNSIEPKHLTFEPEVKNLVSLATDVWKISKYIDKKNEKLVNFSERLYRGLDKFDIKITDFTGQKYSDDLNLKVVDTKNDSSNENNYVVSTESPAIFYKDKLIQQGVVIVNKIEN